jgi:hypothetical protein
MSQSIAATANLAAFENMSLKLYSAATFFVFDLKYS